MPDMAYVSIFMDNDVTHITEDHFEIKLIARLLDQIYVIEPPVFQPRYDDAPPSAPCKVLFTLLFMQTVGNWFPCSCVVR